MGGDYHMNDPRSQSRDLGFSYGSFGPWAGAVMQGLGMMPTGPLSGVTVPAALAYRGYTGKQAGLGGLLGGAMATTAHKSGMLPDEMMMGRAGGMGGGGLLDILGGYAGGAAGNMGMNAGPMG